MRLSFGRTAVAVGVLVLAAGTQANAGCGVMPDVAAHKSAYQGAPFDSGRIELAAATAPTIVGLWEVSFVSGGQQIDFGLSQWHSDGTEFLNSGGRAPATQNYCLGVWKLVGGVYKLNHWAISYDDQGNHNADVNIKEQVTLGQNGNSYSGPFSIQAYDPKTFAKLGPPTTGTISGTRITAD